ncbi:MAG: T9SS type A sorting domain-containing protein [Bacteroidetes bacterium]|nr:T9SS type A sorting domain-containing protein [Bacteroidota bacterium]
MSRIIFALYMCCLTIVFASKTNAQSDTLSTYLYDADSNGVFVTKSFEVLDFETSAGVSNVILPDTSIVTLIDFALSPSSKINMLPVENKSIELSLYPNPAFGVITFQLNKSIQLPAVLFIFDLKGQLVYQSAISVQPIMEYQLPINQLNAGEYILKLENESESVQTNFIKL